MRELGSSHLHHRSPLHLLRQLPATTREPPGHQRQVLHPAAAKSPSNFAPKGAVARGLYPQHGEGPAQQRQALGGDVGGRKSLPHIPEDRLHGSCCRGNAASKASLRRSHVQLLGDFNPSWDRPFLTDGKKRSAKVLTSSHLTEFEPNDWVIYLSFVLIFHTLNPFWGRYVAILWNGVSPRVHVHMACI